MTCIDCCYFWREEGEESRCCHWEPRCPGDIPPCGEEEGEEDVYEDLETGFDPYEGCYTWDC